MVKMIDWKKTVFLAALACIAVCLSAPLAFAQEAAEAAAAGTTLGEGIRVAGIALGAALAVLGGAVGCARAQAAIGAGGTGAMAEKPELFVSVLILVALPETLVVLGFVIGFLIVGMN